MGLGIEPLLVETVVRVPVVPKVVVNSPVELEIRSVDSLWVVVESEELVATKEEDVIAPVVVDACKIS